MSVEKASPKRRRGRPAVPPEQRLSEYLHLPPKIRVDPALADVVCRKAVRERKSVADVIREALWAFAGQEQPI